MEIKFEKKTLRNIGFVAIALIVIYWLLNQPARVKDILGTVENILMPFITGSVLAFILNVPMRAFEKLFKGIKKPTLRRSVAVVLTLICLALVLAIVFMLLIPELSETIQLVIPSLQEAAIQAEKLIAELLETYPQINDWLNSATGGQTLSGLLSSLLSNLETIVPNLFTGALATIGDIIAGLISAFVAVAFAIYALFQKETLARQGRKVLYATLKERIADRIVHILRISNSTFSNFLSGQCIEVCILGSMFAITMAIFNMPYIPLISVLVAVTAFIPIVGAWTGCIVGAFLILMVNPVQAFWFIIMFLVLQQIENNLIYPRVVGTSIGLPGMWVLVAVALGGELMGVFGMFLMIPVVSVMHTLFREFVNWKLSKKDIPEEKLTPQPPDLRSKIKENIQKKKQKRAEKKQKK